MGLNDDLKDELEDTIAGLTDFMYEAQRKAAEQDRRNQALQRERDQLLEQLHQADRKKRAHGGGDFMPDDWEDMQRVSRNEIFKHPKYSNIRTCLSCIYLRR